MEVTMIGSAALWFAGGLVCAGLLPAADGDRNPVPESIGQVLHFTEGQFLAVAEAMPEKSYRFAAAGPGFAGVRTFAEQVMHVACGNFALFNEIEHKAPPERCEKGGPRTFSTKAEILKYLHESFDYGNQVLAAMTDAAAKDKVQGQYWGGTTGLTVAVAAVWHIADHYGQLVPYLRMNNIVPPPTKD